MHDLDARLEHYETVFYKWMFSFIGSSYEIARRFERQQ
jgi:hypothetical protein